MNTKAFGQTFSDVAASIAGTLKTTTKEMDSIVAESLRQGKKFQFASAQKGMTRAMEGRLEKEAVDQIINRMEGKTADEALESVSDILSEKIGEKADVIMKQAKKKTNAIINDASTSDILSSSQTNEFMKYAKYPQAYFNTPDKKVNHTRIGAAVGAYAAATVGGRYLSGGTLTTDGYGKKDIAGIPFL